MYLAEQFFGTTVYKCWCAFESLIGISDSIENDYFSLIEGHNLEVQKDEPQTRARPLTLTRPGFFGCSVAGGGLNQPPPEISAVDRAITMKIGTYVTCGVIYQTIKKKLLKLILY